MKSTTLIIMISILTVTGCSSQQNVKFTDDESVLDFYRRYSKFTDPGEYAYLYENLPDSLPELCSLIKSQFIHPYAELPQYSEQIPKERWNESVKYPTNNSVLEGLLSHDSWGLTKDRLPEDRLVVICRQNALLLASILKYRGIPARVRYGYANYLMADFHMSHTICEVWNKNDKRWMLVDPSMDMVDFSKDKFDFGNDAWLKLQNGEINPDLYGNPGRLSGLAPIVAILCSDLGTVLGTEYSIYQYAPILDYAIKNNNKLSAEHIKILNNTSKLMLTLDAENLSKLQDIYNSTPEIQITETLNIEEINPESFRDENGTSTNDATINKPIIEFVDNESILDFYKQYSSFTDPGEYAYLYKNLPDSLPELCQLIRSQFIHPFAELPQYSDQIPKERWNEFMKYPTVKSVLEGLHKYDPRGLIEDRKVEDRLVLGCRHSAILLASILKHRGIPARVRCGHATYLMPEFHGSHTICEVWNEHQKHWMLVDPSTGMIDFNSEKFDFSNEAWLQLQKGEIDPNLYGIPGKYTGLGSIVGKVPSDLAHVLGIECTIFQYAPLMDYVFDNKQLTAEHIELLNTISELMKSLDAKNLSKLQAIYNSTPDIQITQTNTFNLVDDNKSVNEQPVKKSNIEFVDIPEGTFTMGSPITEQERQDDEIQHKVTLSAFKMSKYPISFEQYDLFCDATGRTKPRGYERGNLPVSQVTWYDAAAFAEWMGCRLPTEAEFEYASRANTTTPFYTGDCLTSEQANFNGNKPYVNCEKGINRKKPIPVGSFSPNAFGLYDMHGNMVEWCSDWYGEYNIDDKINPKGPETGEIKVLRGGGFWNPEGRCRSACRAGDPQGNRGAGLSFRIVKDK